MKKRLSIDERIEIGKKAFDELLATRYDISVKDKIAELYGISTITLGNCLREYKQRVLEPKPTSEELSLFNSYIKNYNKSYRVAELLLVASDNDIEGLLDKYSVKYLIDNIDKYIIDKPDEVENINKLRYIKERIPVINDMLNNKRKSDRNIEKQERKKETYINLANGDITKDDLLSNTVLALREYIKSSDYYPNFIFNKYKLKNGNYLRIIDKLKNSGEPALINLVDEYYKTLALREEMFVSLVNQVYKAIMEENPNILGFYRISHTTINKFKTFVRVSVLRHNVSSFIEDRLNEYFDKYIVGSYSISSYEEALKINYEYNGVQLTSDNIKEICAELYANNIPINRNSIIYTFEEKVSNKVNKR